ncbi:MAG: hypothetical protein ABIH59_01875 [archaeon]
MKNKTKLSFAIFLALALISSVSAAGIVSPYWKDHPLTMDYGETKVIDFNLQNMVGDNDITIELELKKGSNIASLEKTTYFAKLGTHDTMIPLTISIPEDYNGGVQRIEIEAKEVAEDTGGMVTLNAGWMVSFDVIVSEGDVSKSSLTGIIIGLVIAIIVLVLILFIILFRRKK